MIGFALSVFTIMMLAVLAVYLWWGSRHSSAAWRLGHRSRMTLTSSASHGGTDSILKQRMLNKFPEVVAMLGRLSHIQTPGRQLLQSGLDWPVSRFSALTLMVSAMIVIVFSLFDPPSMTLLVLVLAGAPLPALYVMRRCTWRLLKLEAQLPEATDLINRALWAGHSLPTTLEMTGTESPAPIGTGLVVISSQIDFGISMSDAFTGLIDRVPMDDLRYLAVAILIQRESGGSLAEILDNMGKLIHKRLQLLNKVCVLSAEGRLGSWILTLLPPVMGLAVYLLNPELVSTLWTTDAGIRLLWFVITMTCLGTLWIRQIVRIHI